MPRGGRFTWPPPRDARRAGRVRSGLRRARAGRGGAVDGPPPGLDRLDKLEHIASPAARASASLVTLVRSRTVAKVDSTGLPALAPDAVSAVTGCEHLAGLPCDFRRLTDPDDGDLRVAALLLRPRICSLSHRPEPRRARPRPAHASRPDRRRLTPGRPRQSVTTRICGEASLTRVLSHLIWVSVCWWSPETSSSNSWSRTAWATWASMIQ